LIAALKHVTQRRVRFRGLGSQFDRPPRFGYPARGAAIGAAIGGLVGAIATAAQALARRRRV